MRCSAVSERDMTTAHDSVNELVQQLRLLHSQWQETEVLWQDEKAQQFLRDYLAPIAELHRATCNSSARLADVIAHARRSCP
jgi:hypothetical protein